MFEYNATVTKVVDGDTIDAMVDLGFGIWKKVRIRMHGINAPESRTRNLEENENHFILISHGVGKFGRCLGEIYIKGHNTSLNKQLISEGHGTEYFGGKR